MKSTTPRQGILLLVLLCTALVVITNAVPVQKPSSARKRMRRDRTRGLQTTDGIVRKKGGKGKGSSTDPPPISPPVVEAGLEDPEAALANEQKGKDDLEQTDSAPSKGKDKGDTTSPVMSGAEETSGPTFEQQVTSEPTILPESLAPTIRETSSSTDPPTAAPTTDTTDTDEPTPKPTQAETSATSTPTIAPTDAPSTVPTEKTTTIIENAQGLDNSDTQAPTKPPAVATKDPFATPPPNENGLTETDGKDEDLFDGEEDYFHRHLVPFAVSVEGDAVKNDLGITSCLLTAMQKNMTNLFNIEMSNFTIVQFNDEDGDGYNRYDLYFAGFGELLGLPVYSQEYFGQVQLEILGDDAQFVQSCLDSRFANSEQSYTASPLQHDQITPDGLETDAAIGDKVDETGEEGKLRSTLIIGLTVAAVIVALCGIIFASRVLRGGDETAAAARSRK